MEVLLLHVTNLFRVEIEKFDFLCGKRQFETNWYLSLTLGWRPASSKKLHFSPSPLLWTAFRLITICKRMAKINFATKKAYFPTNCVIKQPVFFYACAQAKIWTLYLRIYLDLSLWLSFLHGIVAGQLFRKVTNLVLKE